MVRLWRWNLSLMNLIAPLIFGKFPKLICDLFKWFEAPEAFERLPISPCQGWQYTEGVS